MTDLSTFTDGGLIAGIVSLAAGVLWLRRRLSTDNKIISQEKVETQFITLLQRELESSRKALVESYTDHIKCTSDVSGLQTRVEFLSRENKELRERISHLEARLSAISMVATPLQESRND